MPVLTGADYRADGLGGDALRQHPAHHHRQDLSLDAVSRARGTKSLRCVGAGITFVVAETLAAAIDAAEEHCCRIRAAAGRGTVEAAIADGARRWSGRMPRQPAASCTNGDAAATERAFAAADRVVRARVRNQRVWPATRWSRAPVSLRLSRRRTALEPDDFHPTASDCIWPS